MMPTEASPDPGTGEGRFSDDPVPGLVRAAAAGDAQAWEQLVDRYAGLVWSICRAHRMSDDDAADAAQLTWLRLLENLERVRDPRRLAGWLATTCRRECRALQRRSRSLLTVEEEHMDRLLGGGPPADEPVLTADQHAALWQAFQRLNEWCQKVLRALIVDAGDKSPSYQLVAAQLQTPVGSLGPTRARCLGQLRRLLASDGI
ncbi:MAG: sigma-70 family RNA polymerase sigma factor [Streptosporangiaceae bacterium]|nr:sigma-70 family RNA polymerase sigma factor [Streptosporangiaceae bacterium]MBV9857002.1 sigma-70 family RNA polymerase sigma factor [Streptosporangiaceae bacterium]